MSKAIILICTHNDIENLKITLKSVVESEPIDLLIVDDGSKVKPDYNELRAEFQQFENVYLELKEHDKEAVSQEFALNHGLRFIQNLNKHQFIIRIDAGDLNIPNRCKIQVDFMDDHPNIALAGCFVRMENEKGEKISDFKPEVANDRIRKKIYSSFQFVHSALIFRYELLNEQIYYPTNYKCAEDVPFVYNVIKNHKVANIPLVLVRYTVADYGISGKKFRKQTYSILRIIYANFKFRYIIPILVGTFKAILALIFGRMFLIRTGKVLRKISGPFAKFLSPSFSD